MLDPRPDAVTLRHPDRLFIDGRWVRPVAGGRINVMSPVHDAFAASVGEATAPDVAAAVAAARRAFDAGPWPRMAIEERARSIARFGEELAKRSAELAAAFTLQVGALVKAAAPTVRGALHIIQYYAELDARAHLINAVTPTDRRGVGLVIHEPVGVVAAIAPWNAPLVLMVAKLVPALLAGCTVILKPAPETPLEAYIMAEAAEAAGLPPGVVGLLPAHREAAELLVRSRDVDKVSFTGSTAAGARIAAICGERMGRCSLELGGKSAAIVFDDFDVAAAAKILARTITLNAGQLCATLSRVIVPRALQHAYAEALRGELEKVVVGNPGDPATHMGPLAMHRQLERVEGHVARGVAEGATLVCGGRRTRHMPFGCYFDPTLFTDVDPRMALAQDEIFGPVIALMSHDGEADAIRVANDSPYGLFGAVFTRDNERAYRVARGVRTGALSQNDFRVDIFLPFGGFKQSGIGREGGVASLLGFTETKTLLLDGPPEVL